MPDIAVSVHDLIPRGVNSPRDNVFFQDLQEEKMSLDQMDITGGEKMFE